MIEFNKIRCLSASVALLAGVLAFCACAPKAVILPEAPPPPGGIKVRIVLPDNKIPGEGVVVRGNGKVGRRDVSGNHIISGVGGGKVHVVAELKNAGRRYLAVRTVYVDESAGMNLELRMRDATVVDEFCVDCHPFREKTRNDQIVRDAHPSGVTPVRAVKTKELLDAQGGVTCESCHRIHEETGVPHFVRFTYENGKLCLKCH
jgi:hypothetical protein